MNVFRPTALGIVATLLLLTSSAHAAEPERVPTVLGRRGTVVLDRIVGLSIMTPLGAPRLGALGTYQAGFLTFSNGSSSFGGLESKGGTIGLTPSFDVFVGKNLTLGGEAQLTHQFWTHRSPDSTGRRSPRRPRPDSRRCRGSASICPSRTPLPYGADSV